MPPFANGLRIPSTADELAAETRSATARFAGSRRYGLLSRRLVAMPPLSNRERSVTLEHGT